MSDLELLKQEKEKYGTKIFWLGLEIAFIFGIPAVIGAFVGKKLEAYYGVANVTFGILVFTFFLSWFLIIRKYKKLMKKMNEIDSKIKSINSQEK